MTFGFSRWFRKLGEGFTETDGARPLVRAIQKHINRPIREAWFGEGAPHGLLRLLSLDGSI